MLVLSRRLGERLKIGDEIEIVILGIQGNQVRLGIDAPKSINVVREELIGRQSHEARSETPPDYPRANTARPRLGLQRSRRTV